MKNFDKQVKIVEDKIQADPDNIWSKRAKDALRKASEARRLNMERLAGCYLKDAQRYMDDGRQGLL